MQYLWQFIYCLNCRCPFTNSATEDASSVLNRVQIWISSRSSYDLIRLYAKHKKQSKILHITRKMWSSIVIHEHWSWSKRVIVKMWHNTLKKNVPLVILCMEVVPNSDKIQITISITDPTPNGIIAIYNFSFSILLSYTHLCMLYVAKSNSRSTNELSSQRLCSNVGELDVVAYIRAALWLGVSKNIFIGLLVWLPNCFSWFRIVESKRCQPYPF